MPVKEKYALMPLEQKKKHRKTAYYKERSTKKGHISQIARARKCAAKKQNIQFSVSLEYLVSIAPENCPVLGIPLSWSKSSGFNSCKDNFPSIDRHSPTLGYIEGNVVWMSYLANRMKSNATPEQLHKFADWIKLNIKE